MKTIILNTLALTTLSVIPLLHLASYRRYKTSLSRLGVAAFAFIVAGLFLSRQQSVGFGLLAIGLMLAVVDIIRKRKLDHHTNAPR
jgi:hypothetical protein